MLERQFKMAQITIEVPDEFAQILEQFQGQLPELFTRFISAALLSSRPPNTVSTPSLQGASPPATYQEVLDFLIGRPTSNQIVEFRVSEQSQSRLQSLLEKNRDAVLSPEEKSELTLYEQLDTLMGLLKAKALISLRSNLES